MFWIQQHEMIVQSQRLFGELGGTLRRSRAWGNIGSAWFLRTNHMMFRGGLTWGLAIWKWQEECGCPIVDLGICPDLPLLALSQANSTSPCSCVLLLGLTSLSGLQGIQGAHTSLTAACHCLSHLPWTPWLCGTNSYQAEDTVEEGMGAPVSHFQSSLT